MTAKIQPLSREQRALVTFALNRVSRSTGVLPQHILGPRRFANVALARHLVMAVLRVGSDMSLVQIGAAIGHRDHGTVIHACRSIASRRAANPNIDIFFRLVLSDIARFMPVASNGGAVVPGGGTCPQKDQSTKQP